MDAVALSDLLKNALAIAGQGPVGWIIAGVLIVGAVVLWWISSRGKIEQAKQESDAQAAKDHASNTTQNQAIEDKAKEAENKINQVKKANPDLGKK